MIAATRRRIGATLKAVPTRLARLTRRADRLANRGLEQAEPALLRGRHRLASGAKRAWAWTWPRLRPWVARFFAAIAVGVIGGLLITRRHWWLALVPLSGFVIGGWLLSTQFSNTQGYGGGDWSVAAIVVVSGIFNGLIATLILLNTALARGPLRMVVHWPANRRPGASTAG